MNGKTARLTDFMMQVNRNGYNENCFFDVSYSPIRKEDGKVAGILVTSIETTKKKESFQQLEKNDQVLRALVKSAPFPISVFAGKEMRIILANQAMIDTWGKGNNVIGKLYAEILPELENQQIYKQLNDVYTTGIPINFKNQKVNLIKKGKLKTFYFNFSLTPLLDVYDQIYGVMNIAAEVTELNEAKQKVEAALQEIKVFKYMADNAGDPLMLLREDESFAYLNQATVQKWGYTKEELMKLKIGDIDDIYSGDTFKDLFNKNLKEVVPTFETLNKNKAGFVYPVEVSVGPVHLDGEKYIFAISRDISERKKAERDQLNALHKIEDSEKRFRNSVEQAPMGIAIFRGPDHIVELANKAYLAIRGKKAETLIGHPFFETHPELEEQIKPFFNHVISTRQPFYGNEFPFSLKRMGTLEQTYFNMVYHPLKDDSGEISGIMVVATEVTSMVKAKQLLEEREKYFRKLVTQSPIGMTILKGDKFIVDTINQVLLKNMWGKKEEEVIGKSIKDIFQGSPNQKYNALLNKVYKSGITHSEKESIFYVEKQNETKKLFIDFEYAPLHDPNGTICGIMVTVNDVTDKVEARKKVEDAEERLRLATEGTGVATWDLDLDKRSIIHSQQLAAIFGHTPSTILTHLQILRQVHPDDAPMIEKALSKALMSGIYAYEGRIIKPDNSISWIRVRGSVFFDENKTPVKMLGNLQDITDEKNYQQILEESESKFRLLTNMLAQQVWLTDAKGSVYYFNETVHNFTGLTKEELINDGWIYLMHPEDIEENSEAWRKSISTGNEFLFEHRFKRFDGVYRWQISRAIPHRDAVGNIQMWVGSSTDIQEIKEHEEQKDLFISMASHELKTPLTSIKGYVQILQSMQANVEKAFLEKSLGIIHKQINKLTQLIAELLDVSKIKSGGLDFNIEEFEMTALVREIVAEIRHINPLYEISFEAKEKINVFADRNRIGQVLINFLNNAVKYSPNSKLVKVYCRLHGNRVRISVEDSGIGIDKKNQDNIFQRFYRVEGRSEKTFPGFGIGLFISDEIVKRHGGIIQVESELGKGSIFSFEIPVTSTNEIDATDLNK